MGIAQTRRYLGAGGFFGSALMLVCSMQTTHPMVSVGLVGVASFCSDLTLPGAWGVCSDVGGAYAGALSATMNCAGQISGAIAPTVVPLILARYQDNWNVNIGLFAVSYALGGVCWLFVNSDDRIDT